MRQRYFHSKTSKITFLLDVLAVMASLSIAVAVRSQFGDYLFAFSTAISVFSLALFLRILSLFLFDAYTVSFATFTNGDMQRIMRINLLPSLLLLLLRLVSPVVSLRMPISMIVIEYIGTTLGFIVIRTVTQSLVVRQLTTVGHRERILLWAEVADVREQIPSIEEFSRYHRVEIVGILNANPLFWDTEFDGIRVHGDESKLHDLLAADDRIAAVCFLIPEEMTRSRSRKLMPVMHELNLRVAVIRDGCLTTVSPARFEELAGNGAERGELRPDDLA